MDQELGCSTLVNYGDVRAPKLDVDEKVSHYASSDGDQDFNHFKNLIPYDIYLEIQSVVPLQHGISQDRIT